MVNFENLIKIRDWLTANDVPFDMSNWRGVGDGAGCIKVKPKCLTHGCVIGWCPEIPGLEPIPEDWWKDGSFRWLEYAYRITGTRDCLDLFDFLFAGEWADTKYSRKEDAIRRLDWVVSGRVRYLSVHRNEVSYAESLEWAMETYVYGEDV